MPLSSIKCCDVLKGYPDPCDEHGFVLGGGFSQEQGAKTVSGIELLSTIYPSLKKTFSSNLNNGQ